MRELLKWVVALLIAVPLWLLATLAPIFWFVGLVQEAAESGAFSPKDFFLFATTVAVLGLFLSNKHVGPKCSRPILSKAAVLYILSALSWVLLGALFAVDLGNDFYEEWSIQALAVACFAIGHFGFVWGSALWLLCLRYLMFDYRSETIHQKPSADKSSCDVLERRGPSPLSFGVVAALGLVMWVWERLSRHR